MLWTLLLIFISVRCRNPFDRIAVSVAVTVDVARLAPVAAAAAVAALSTAGAAVALGQAVVEPRKEILQHSPVDTCAPAHGDTLTPPTITGLDLSDIDSPIYLQFCFGFSSTFTLPLPLGNIFRARSTNQTERQSRVPPGRLCRGAY